VGRRGEGGRDGRKREEKKKENPTSLFRVSLLTVSPLVDCHLFSFFACLIFCAIVENWAFKIICHGSFEYQIPCPHPGLLSSLLFIWWLS
jgi:hypothetical protein